MNQFLLYAGLGVVTAAILALSAVALTLEYAVSKVANLAHGELLTIGAYTAYVVMHNTGIVPLAAFAAAAVGAIGGVATNLVVIERFAGRPAITTLIATLGVSLMVQNICIIIFGGANVGFTISQGAPQHIGPFLLTPADMLVTLSAVLVGTLLYVLLQRTKFGKSIRAVSENRELARASGIPAKRVVTATWAIAGAIAGFAGFILAESIGTFNSSLGFSYLLLTLTAAVAGGLGRPYGTMVGALVVGMILQLAGAYSDPSYEVAFAIGVLVILILVRPNGLFASGKVEKL